MRAEYTVMRAGYTHICHRGYQIARSRHYTVHALDGNTRVRLEGGRPREFRRGCNSGLKGSSTGSGWGGRDQAFGNRDQREESPHVHLHTPPLNSVSVHPTPQLSKPPFASSETLEQRKARPRPRATARPTAGHERANR